MWCLELRAIVSSLWTKSASISSSSACSQSRRNFNRFQRRLKEIERVSFSLLNSREMKIVWQLIELGWERRFWCNWEHSIYLGVHIDPIYISSSWWSWRKCVYVYFNCSHFFFGRMSRGFSSRSLLFSKVELQLICINPIPWVGFFILLYLETILLRGLVLLLLWPSQGVISNYLREGLSKISFVLI